MEDDELVPLAGVFGGGGLFGIGYTLGVLEGLSQRGLDLRTAPLLGTSAGVWAAAAYVTETAFEQICPARPIRLPDYRPGHLRRVARELVGDQHATNVTAVAVRLPLLRRELLDGHEHRLADQIAASSAVPGVFLPQRIGSHIYVDGGVRSAVSADLGRPAARLVLVAPLAGVMFGPAGRFVARRTNVELEAWRDRGGREVVAFCPDGSLVDEMRHPAQLFDPTHARHAFDQGMHRALRVKLGD